MLHTSFYRNAYNVLATADENFMRISEPYYFKPAIKLEVYNRASKSLNYSLSYYLFSTERET